MNERDSEMISGMLIEAGYDMVDDASKADIVLFNTCSVRQHAEDRVINNIRTLAHARKNDPDFRVGVLGCMAQRHGEMLFKELPVDIVVGPNNIYNIPQLLNESLTSQRLIAVDRKTRPKKGEDPHFRTAGLGAFVNVMYGCDNFCSYCIVPHVRGREVSRPKKDIVKEVKMLADKGFKEITLLGQNVNSYGKGQTQKVDFPEILEAVNAIKGLERIRFTTSHPKDAGEGLFKAMRDLDKVCEHIHLPLQSGSDKVLDLMNRKYKYEEYKERVELLRSMVPEVGITTDIIVGFPSEKEQDHEATKRAMKEIGFNAAFIFQYSPRPPAVSSFLIDDVPKAEKARRNNELLAMQRHIAHSKHKALVGTVQEILVEGKSRMSEEEMVGKTRSSVSCVFPGDESLIGHAVKVQIRDSSPYTLKGERLPDSL
jgi:tRNA-2-methylthio-N6-dimethylallyladenosine synthase